MTLLNRYIAKAVLQAIALITLILLGLQIFILFVRQLDELGRADYGIWQATQFVLLQAPYQVYLFFPLASLLGALTGLGVLANHRELLVMRASGMSIGQITLAVLQVALSLILVVTLFGETLMPKFSLYANDLKMQALSGGQALRTDQGIWLRDHNDFINIGRILANNSLEEVYQFHFKDNHHLGFARRIERIDNHPQGWLATGVHETAFFADHTVSKNYPSLPWEVNLKPNIIRVISNDPDEMTLKELQRYLRNQHQNHQSALSYQLAYWQRLVQPLTNVVMMILAIPFIFGPLRSSTMGSKLVAGATVGFGFHIMNRFFGSLGQVLQWPPLLSALLPTLLFALIGIYLMRRVR